MQFVISAAFSRFLAFTRSSSLSWYAIVALFVASCSAPQGSSTRSDNTSDQEEELVAVPENSNTTSITPATAAQAQSIPGAACETGDITACVQLIQAVMSNTVTAAQALPFLQGGCRHEHGVSCLLVAAIYVDGEGGLRDIAAGIEAGTRACELNTYRACTLVGMLYLTELFGRSRDFARAAELFERACSGGESEGCYELGKMAFRALGQPHDERRAALLFRRACRGGNAQSCRELGSFYINRTSLPPEPARGVELIASACSQDDADACCEHALLLRAGEHVQRNEAEAATILERLCEDGTRAACERMHDTTFTSSERLARVTAVSGPTSIPRDASCQVSIENGYSCSTNCRVQINCGAEILYGAYSINGFNDCLVTERDTGPPTIHAIDSTPDTGGISDPELDLNTETGRVIVASGQGADRWVVTLQLQPQRAQRTGPRR